MADKTYAMTRRRQLSSTAVHMVDKALKSRASVSESFPGIGTLGPSAIEPMKKSVREQSAAEPSLTFDSLPESNVELDRTLGVILETFDWDKINADAQYWSSQSRVSTMFTRTSIWLIADGIQEVLERIFARNIFQIILNEGMVPVGASRDHELAFLALAFARIGVLFGSSVDPESVPVQENLVTLGEALERAGLEASAECRDAERQLTLLPGDEERIQLEEERDSARALELDARVARRVNGPKNGKLACRG
ncbi:MAG: hypothetical protein AB2570_20650 [Candidatus Thiodiazotropha endolucinida]